jgi:hypothetical protein
MRKEDEILKVLNFCVRMLLKLWFAHPIVKYRTGNKGTYCQISSTHIHSKIKRLAIAQPVINNNKFFP